MQRKLIQQSQEGGHNVADADSSNSSSSEEGEQKQSFKTLSEHYPYESQFMWNRFLIKPFYNKLEDKRWIVPVIYGYCGSSNFSFEEHNCTICVIARRSRKYAGTRYMKRGIDKHGNVANFVEVEQICYINCLWQDLLPNVTSFVQIRGSIPLFWF